MSSATVTSKGQITIPADIREAFGIEPGDKLEFVPRDGGGLDILVLNATAQDFFDSLKGFERTNFIGSDEGAIARILTEDNRSTLSTEAGGTKEAAE